MSTKKYRKTAKADWYRTALVLFLFITVMVFSSIFLRPGCWYLLILIIITGTLLLVNWHTKNFAYLCPICGRVFEVSTLENFLGPDRVNKKFLKCPKCGKRSWAQILRIEK
ncbi:hypothetical protein [Methanosarcina soligelidi]|uniref:hypothetical protein n=1 Tax=Methanosarcina soligelidi TaxID=1036677 RepID=UPI00064F8DD5|nr:hypothetical protein [Methanosarcina soligelidi]